MAMQTGHKWIIVILAIIFLGLIAYFIYKATAKAVVAPATPGSTTTNPGLLDTAQTWLCKAFPQSKLCGGKGKGFYETTGCDPDRPGYNLDGLYDNNCQ